MGADTKSLRVRIKSVNSTLHLTKAMGLVASSKIRRAMDKMTKSKEYSEALEAAVNLLAGSSECKKSPYMRKSEGGKIKLIVIAGDRGLAGGYNANVFRLVKSLPDADILPIGKRAAERYGGEFYSSEMFGYNEAMPISERICKEFSDGIYDRVGIVSTKYRSMLSQDAVIKWVLPFEKNNERNSSVIFEPDELSVLDYAVPEYLAGVLIASVRESFACEVAARRAAMDSAGKNAQEMIDNLQLEYNRARQGAITQEITEIVAGSGI